MTVSSITAEDQQFVETWENIAEYSNAIVRLDRKGDEKPEVITGRRTFMLTTAERLITQDKILQSANDPFANGAFRPVVVPDDVTVETNPNALSEEQILQVLGSSEFAWGEWLANIDSPATLRRMLAMADDVDGLSFKRYKEISEKLALVKPKTRIQSNDPELRKFIEPAARKGVTSN